MTKNSKSYAYNKTVREALTSRPRESGEVGIEIECEGKHLPTLNDVEKYWTIHADGSLRGESSEYVLVRPVIRDEVTPSLEYLRTVFDKCKTKIKDSYRTSVHVHLNMQNVTICKTYTTILMYGILEDILTEYAGQTRVGNLFCLRMSDAEFMLEALRNSANRDRYEDLNDNAIRYAGCNAKSLFDHNSLEFRAFRGTTDMKLISQWIDILLQIKDASIAYDNPSSMCADFSSLGPDGFLIKNFRKDTVNLIQGFKNYSDRIVSGVRLVQDVAYANDWSRTPDKIDSKSDKEKFVYYDTAGQVDGVRNGHPGDLLDQIIRNPPRVHAVNHEVRFRNAIAPLDDWPARDEEDL